MLDTLNYDLDTGATDEWGLKPADSSTRFRKKLRRRARQKLGKNWHAKIGIALVFVLSFCALASEVDGSAASTSMEPPAPSPPSSAAALSTSIPMTHPSEAQAAKEAKELLVELNEEALTGRRRLAAEVVKPREMMHPAPRPISRKRGALRPSMPSMWRPAVKKLVAVE